MTFFTKPFYFAIGKAVGYVRVASQIEITGFSCNEKPPETSSLATEHALAWATWEWNFFRHQIVGGDEASLTSILESREEY